MRSSENLTDGRIQNAPQASSSSSPPPSPPAPLPRTRKSSLLDGSGGGREFVRGGQTRIPGTLSLLSAFLFGISRKDPYPQR